MTRIGVDPHRATVLHNTSVITTKVNGCQMRSSQIFWRRNSIFARIRQAALNKGIGASSNRFGRVNQRSKMPWLINGVAKEISSKQPTTGHHA